MGFAFYEFYTGNLIEDSLLRINFEESISKGFGMFFLVNLFQNSSLWMITMLFIESVIQVIQIKKIKKGE